MSEHEAVIVVGLHRSGSSCVAGCLSRLGVHFGNKFIGCEPEGGHEDQQLAAILERAMPFPMLKQNCGWKGLIQWLEPIVIARRQEAQAMGTLFGFKYPHLCSYAPALDVLARCAVINCERDIEESIQSLILRSQRARHRHPPKQLEKLQRWLHERKVEYLTRVTHHTVQYDDLCRDPATTCRRMANYLGLLYRAESATFVKPGMRRVGADKNL